MSTEPETVNRYQRLDEDLDRINAFNNRMADPGTSLGAMLEEWFEDVQPRTVRVEAELDRLQHAIAGQPGEDTAAVDEEDDVPF